MKFTINKFILVLFLALVLYTQFVQADKNCGNEDVEVIAQQEPQQSYRRRFLSGSEEDSNSYGDDDDDSDSEQEPSNQYGNNGSNQNSPPPPSPSPSGGSQKQNNKKNGTSNTGSGSGSNDEEDCTDDESNSFGNNNNNDDDSSTSKGSKNQNKSKNNKNKNNGSSNSENGNGSSGEEDCTDDEPNSYGNNNNNDDDSSTSKGSKKQNKNKNNGSSNSGNGNGSSGEEDCADDELNGYGSGSENDSESKEGNQSIKGKKNEKSGNSGQESGNSESENSESNWEDCIEEESNEYGNDDDKDSSSSSSGSSGSSGKCKKNKNSSSWESFEENDENDDGTPKPIRITFDTTGLEDNCPYNYYYVIKKIKRTLKIASKFLAEQLLVERRDCPIRLPNNFNKCSTANIPYKDRQKGYIDDTDLHVYVTFNTDYYYNWVAGGTSCLADSNGRPIVGMVSYNLVNLDELNYLGDRDFEDLLEITLHQLVHVLGFEQSHIQFWKNPQTNQPYNQPIKNQWVRNVKKQVLATPKVKEYAKQYYGCDSIKGVQLEEGCNSHWEKTVLVNEFMTAYRLQNDASYSKFTFAALEDTGFYKPTYKNLDELSWGRNKGCNFLLSCDADEYREFTKYNQIGCDFHSVAKGSSQLSELSDCRYIRVNQSNPVFCNDICNESYNDNFTGEYWGHNSRCFESDLIRDSCQNNYENMRCLESYCVNDKIKIVVNGQQYDCDSSTNKCQIYHKGVNQDFTGVVTLPHDDWSHFCNEQLNPCKNQCSQNGICSGNICHCLTGYYGEDCSLCCPDGKYAHNDKCVNECPEGTELVLPSRWCKPVPCDDDDELECDDKCKACEGASDYCTECQDGYQLEPDCINCEDGYYKKSSGQCVQCQFPCATCSESAQNCDSCQFPAKQTPFPECACKDGYFEKSNDCKSCVNVCKTCETSASDCLECKDDLKIPPLCCECQDGYYLDNNNDCKECQYPCDKCTKNKCESCINPANRDPETCQCLPGFQDVNKCCVKIQCPDTCYSCDNDGNCDACDPGCNLDPDTNCTECLDGFYLQNGICKNCPYPCETCSGPTDSCITCSHETRPSPPLCSCESGTVDIGVEQCSQCPPQCKECDSSLKCTECEGDYQDPDNNCECQSGYYQGPGKDCLECSDPCDECTAPNLCTSCIDDPNYTRNKNQGCSCPPGTYSLTPSSNCQQCTPNCATCDHTGACTSCSSNYGVVNQLSNCPCKEGTYQDSNKQCQDCPVTCVSCTSPTNCDQCIDNELVQNNATCDCADGSYPTADGCDECADSCAICTSLENCTQCEGNNRDKNNDCQCKTGFYEKDGDCVPNEPCPDYCGGCDCLGNCTSCADENLIFPNCQECEHGWFLSSQWVCDQCDDLCDGCAGAADCCSDCIGNNNTRALPYCNCKASFFENNQPDCSPCPADCSECTNLDTCQSCYDSNADPSTKCQNCLPNHHKSGGQCVPNIDCTPPCTICTPQGVCSECPYPNLDKEQNCEFCIQGWYILPNGQCDQCEPQCLTCGGQADCCGVCQGANRNDDAPDCSCVTGFYDNGDKNCVPCLSICETCINGTKCETCKGENRNPDNNCNCNTRYHLEDNKCVKDAECLQPCDDCDYQGICESCIDPLLILPDCDTCSGNNYLSSNWVCSPCSYKCNGCQTSANNCDSCSHNTRDYDNSCDCKPGYYEEDPALKEEECNQCPIKCATCTSATNCQTCKKANYDPDTLCLECKENYHKDGQGNCVEDIPCTDPCDDCDCYGICNSCPHPELIKELNCSQCKPGWFFVDGPSCQQCNTNLCLTCDSDADDCQVCATNIRENAPACTCKAGYWDDGTDDCAPCDPKCQTCDNSTDCIICLGANRDPNNDCECSENYHLEGGVCVEDAECLPPCASCNFYGICESCLDNELIKPDCTQCNHGFYLSSQWVCSACSIICDGCTDSSTDCDSCNSNTRENSPACDCKQGYYENDTISQHCSQCPNLCKTCNDANDCTLCKDSNKDPDTQCQECKTGYHKQSGTGPCVQDIPCTDPCTSCNCYGVCDYCPDPRHIISSNCSECQDGWFIKGDGYCDQCDIQCAKCNGTSDNCDGCSSTNRDPTDDCKCKDGFYDNSTQHCEGCSDECETCSNGTKCDICKGEYRNPDNNCECSTGYHEEGQVCVEDTECLPPCASCDCYGVCKSCLDDELIKPTCNQCNHGFYLSSEWVCSPCDENCDGCSNSSTYCTNCAGNRVNSPTCECPLGYYDDDVVQCEQCPAECSECDSATICTNCVENNRNPGLLCIPCLPNFHEDPITGQCVEDIPCTFPCTVCDPFGVCTGCPQTEHILLSNCSECIDGFYVDTGYVCNNCNSQKCETCENNANECIKCAHSNRINPPVCGCKPGYYEDGTADCAQCSEECETCDNGTICTKCLGDNRNHLQNCDCNQDFHEEDGICVPNVPCPDQCSDDCDCYGKCITCVDPWLDSEQNCEKCLANYYLVEEWDCDPCEDQCNGCTGTADCCDSCASPGTRKTAPLCECQDGFYENNTPDCEPCPSGCSLCTSDTSCSSCADPNEDPDTLCQQCLVNHYRNAQNNCVPNIPCTDSCTNCNYLGVCLSCPDENHVKSDNCNSCNPGWFGNADGLCDQCSNQCQNCNNNAENCDNCQGANRNDNAPTCSCIDEFWDNGSIDCVPCLSICATCDNGTKCLTCKGENRNPDNDCNCLPNHHLNDDNECVEDAECLPPCSTCDCQGNCLTCQDSNLDKDQGCLVCKDKYYLEYQWKCTSCDIQCDTCAPNGPASECTSCSHSTRVGLPTCECDSGKYEIENQAACGQCEVWCKECTANGCYECPGANQDPDNQCNCLSTHFLNESNECQLIADCNLPCSECNCYGDCTGCHSQLTMESGCTQCADGYYLPAGELYNCEQCDWRCPTCNDVCCETCLDTNRSLPHCYCNSGYVEIGENQVCQQCPSSCSECQVATGGGLECTECSLANRDPPSCGCQYAHYEDCDGNCQPCSAPCQTCTELECQTCLDPSRSLPDCKCPLGQYAVSATAPCQPCPNNCETCDNTGFCETCPDIDGFNQHDPDCGCLDGYFMNDNLICELCNWNCATCENNYECITCRQNPALHNDPPQCTCIDGYFTLDYACFECLPYCALCEEQHTCEQCEGSNRNEEDYCLCHQYYYDNGTAHCQSCQPPCLECVGIGLCTSCIGGNRQPALGCICLDGFYASDTTSTCYECDPKCAACDVNGNCTACVPRYGCDMVAPACGCQDGMYEDANGYCQPCSLGCDTCSSSPDNCTTCKIEDYRTNSLPSCPCQSNALEITGSCQLCYSKCTSCSHHPANCDECAPGRQNNPPACSCSIKYYEDINQDCQPCLAKCASCNNGTTCMTCVDQLASGPNCDCQSGSYYNSSENKCKSCPEGCSNCNGPLDCLDETFCNQIKYDISYECIDIVLFTFQEKVFKTTNNPVTFNSTPSYLTCTQLFDSIYLDQQFGINPLCSVLNNDNTVTIRVQLTSQCNFNENLDIVLNSDLFRKEICANCDIISVYELDILSPCTNCSSPPTADIYTESQSYLECQDISLQLTNFQNTGYQQLQNVQWSVLSTTSTSQSLSGLNSQLSATGIFTASLSLSNVDIVETQTIVIQAIFQNYLGQQGSQTINLTIENVYGIIGQLINSTPIVFNPTVANSIQFSLTQETCDPNNCPLDLMQYTIHSTNSDFSVLNNLEQSASSQTSHMNIEFQIPANTCQAGQTYYIQFKGWLPNNNEQVIINVAYTFSSSGGLPALKKEASQSKPTQLFNPPTTSPIQKNDVISWSCIDENTQSDCLDKNGQFIEIDSTDIKYEADLSQFKEGSVLTFTVMTENQQGEQTEQSCTFTTSSQELPELYAIIPQKVFDRSISTNEEISLLITQSENYKYSMEKISGKIQISIDNQMMTFEQTFNYPQFTFQIHDFLDENTVLSNYSQFTVYLEINLEGFTTPYHMSFSGSLNLAPKNCKITLEEDNQVSIKDTYNLEISQCEFIYGPLKYSYKLFTSHSDYLDNKSYILSSYSINTKLSTFLPQSSDENSDEIILQMVAQDKYGSQSSFFKTIKVQPLPFSELEAEIQQLLSQPATNTQQIRKLSLISLELQNREKKGGLSEQQKEQLEDMEQMIYSALQVMENKLVNDLQVQHQFAHTMNQISDQKQHDSTTVSKKLNYIIENISSLFEGITDFSSFSSTQVQDILMTNLKYGSNLLLQLEKSGKLRNLSQEENNTQEPKAIMKQLVTLVSQILSKIVSPNSEKFTYTNDLITFVFQKQSNKMVQDLVNDQQGLQNFIANKNSTDTTQQKEIIFDKNVSKLTQQTQKVYDVSYIEFRPESQVPTKDLNIIDEDKDIKLKEQALISYIFNNSDKTLECVAKSQKSWENTSCNTTIKNDKTICECYTLNEITLKDKTESPQSYSEKQAQILLSPLSLLVISLLVLTLGFMGIGYLLDSKHQQEQQQQQGSQKQERLQFQYRQARRNSSVMQATDMTTGSVNSDDVNITTTSENNSDTSRTFQLSQAQLSEVQQQQEQKKSEQISSSIDYHQFLSIIFSKDQAIPRWTQFLIYFASIFVWIAISTFICSRFKFENYSLITGISLGFLLIGSNALHKLQCFLIKTNILSSNIGLVIFNSIIYIVSAGLIYYQMFAISNLKLLTILISSNLAINVFILQTFSAIFSKKFLKQDDQLDMKVLPTTTKQAI